MRSRLALTLSFATMLCALCGTARAGATQPSTQPVKPAAPSGAMEVRATEAFNRGEYALALPMLKKLEAQLQSQPNRVGPIQERIRVCERNIAAGPADPQAAALERPADGPPTAENRKAHPAPKPGEVVEMSIKDLGNFEYDAENGGEIPADVKRLSGATLRLRGFMMAPDQAENITQFALVPSLFACCYGQPPQIQHTIMVNCPKGKAVSYSPDELVVEGKLTVEEKKEEGYTVSLFEVEVSSVKPAAK